MTPDAGGHALPRVRAAAHAGSCTARNISAAPTVTYVLIAINVIIFIGELATGVGAVERRARRKLG